MKLNKYKGLWKSKTNQNVNIKKTIIKSFPKVIFAVYELKHHNSLRPYCKNKTKKETHKTKQKNKMQKTEKS